ncbi:NADPH-dependent F420 reductase [Gordonia rhizosphera]|uniref:Putative F420-dependent NADPH reductase n=1 Tax=Gordonia rhizosphera NBRC 16068 TaxID=1108045 RepID=K6V3T4_9ACTN|nr:NAD(P)-binding domain-containing protein [Gordonia rhizosphera]GAB90763.1 putative F420-dependent NADPH reductase [Gordonia rhizosphera NBRC 16068]
MSSIAIIGPGRHGTAIAGLFASHGVDVTLYHHNPHKARLAADTVATLARPGTAVTVADDVTSAVAGQQVVALTTLWDRPQREVIGQLGSALEGKVLLDVSNPLDVTPRGIVARWPAQGSAGQFVATLLPSGVGHAKAFSNLATDFIMSTADHDPLAVLPFLADSDDTAALVRPLLAETGWLPWYAGDISRSRHIEIGGMFNTVTGRYGRARPVADEFRALAGDELVATR